MRRPIDVVILCGGLGTRFRSVFSDRPKALAQIHEKPLLDIILSFFIRHGYQRCILRTGYLSERIEKYYHKSPFAKNLFFSRETEPLGTGGAIKNAEAHITTENFFVMNGDSYCDIDLPTFHDFHDQKEKAFISMVLASHKDREDAGNVLINEDNDEVTSFSEKTSNNNKKYINAGIYIFHKKILEYIPEKQNVSLEYSIFPQFINKGFYGFISDSEVIDIGTPERYKQALKYFSKNNIMTLQ